jgi:tight adherence protein B
VALWMTLTRPEYLRPLYTQPVGILMSVSGVVLTVVGWFWMSKLAKVEV